MPVIRHGQTMWRVVMGTEFHCVPICLACRQSGDCPNAGQAYVTLPEPPAPEPCRSAGWAPNQHLLLAPCGCWCLPIELWVKLGDCFETFMCDIHGDIKITDAYRKRTNKATRHYVRTSTKYGYTVSELDTLL